MLIVFLATLCLLSACAQPPEPGPAPEPEKPIALDTQLGTLQKGLEKQERVEAELKDEIASLRIQLLEKEALITGLERHNLELQKRFDDAIVEVVRTKARLRSLESKADAASTIAEIEVALKALKNTIPENQADIAEITKAEELLEMSSQEFKRQNFGGALYLASQAKTQIRIGHLVLSGGRNLDILEGEILFVQPLPLLVTKNSNLRAGPDITQKILAQLKEGTSVVAYSYRGKWVRIETEGKKSGWIFQSLVSAP
jgi:uncharacterized protein YgiM (DUF1202 family)